MNGGRTRAARVESEHTVKLDCDFAVVLFCELTTSLPEITTLSTKSHNSMGHEESGHHAIIKSTTRGEASRSDVKQKAVVCRPAKVPSGCA